MKSVSWSQVLAWRMRRQFLERPHEGSVVELARRLAGVQAQVTSSAQAAVAVRQAAPEAVEQDLNSALLDDRTLAKSWAMRGTLHLLPADEFGAYMAISGAHRNWERGSWQKASGATPADLEAIAAAAAEALAGGGALTREELTAEIVKRTGSAHLQELLSSGWSPLLKPLACWGVLCHGPPNGNRITFVSPAEWLPGWQGVPPLDEAAPVVIRAYLGAHGPTTPDSFDKVWLSRGFMRKPLLRSWFEAMDLVSVDVEGTPMLMLPGDLDELADTPPSESVRLLPGFDPYILGGGTGTVQVVPAGHRAEVSRKAGWISPVVLYGGRAAGTWTLTGGSVDTTLWEQVPADALAVEIERVQALA